MTEKTTTKKQRATMVRVSILLLVVLYCVGASQLELLHAIIHQHEVATTHVGQKQEACDEAIFHNDTEHGCPHESHLKASDKCHLCDLAYHGDQTVLTNIEFSTDDVTTEHFYFYELRFDSYRAVISSSRAPPLFV